MQAVKCHTASIWCQQDSGPALAGLQAHSLSQITEASRGQKMKTGHGQLMGSKIHILVKASKRHSSKIILTIFS